MSLNKTMVILAGITAMGTAVADEYTQIANPDVPTLGSLAANYNEQAPKVSVLAVKGAAEFIKANESSVKSGEISAETYAQQTAKQLLTPKNPLIGILPTKLAQACLTVYGADLMQKAHEGIKGVTKSEASMRHVAEQTNRTENPNMVHNLTSDLGVNLVKHDILTNLTQGRTQTAAACFELEKVLDNEKPNPKSIELAQQKGAEGLETIKNYEDPFNFSDAEVTYMMDQVPELKQKGIDKMSKEDRNEVIKNYTLQQDGKVRAESYLNAYQKKDSLTVSVPTREALTTTTGKTTTVNMNMKRTGRA